MRKFMLFYTFFMVFVFMIPVFATNCNKKSDAFSSELVSDDSKNQGDLKESKENKSIINKDLDKRLYDYKDFSKIKLVNTVSNTTTEIDLDEYLYGVVSAEMPANYDIEALKAQAVVARTYTIYNITNNKDKHEDGAICTSSSCCQAWISKEDRMEKWSESEREANWNKIVEAVESTKGQIITYEGQPIDAFFHSNSGGKTETPVEVWGGTNYPYLAAVETAGEDAYAQYQSEVTYSKKDLEKKIIEKYKNFTINWNENECIKILEHTQGNRVKKIKIGNKEFSGVEIRSILSLKSANFNFSIDGENITFSVIGYGHGVGMSQTGADSLAKSGENYESIIKHFYQGVEIVNY